MESNKNQVAALEARISNLELALHAMWAALRDLQPPGTQHDIDRMMRQHFAASTVLGGFDSVQFNEG